MRPDFALPQIATGDLDIAVVSQLPPPKFPLSDKFEPGAVKMVGFQAAFRRWAFPRVGAGRRAGARERRLHIRLRDAEFDGRPVGVPPGVFGK